MSFHGNPEHFGPERESAPGDVPPRSSRDEPADDRAAGDRDAGYGLAPDSATPDTPEPEPWYRWSNPLADNGDDSEAPAESYQFSLGQLMLLAAVVAGLLSLLNLLPHEYAAGITGLGVLISLVAISILKPPAAIVHVAWWAMLFIYLLMCASAIVGRS